jgi:SNF2 family DNA or RNA helicase
VVCPASLKSQWRTEIERACGATTEIISGGARDRAEQYRTTKAFFILINYELLHRDLENIRSLKPDLIVLDEAQRIKNWQTKTSRTLKRLESPYRIALTGTPLENRLAELQSVTEFLNPRALGAPWKLMPTYSRLDEDGKVIGYTNLDRLRGRMGRFLIRRTRPEVLSQLPRRTDNNFWTRLTDRQKEVHDELAAQVLRLVQKWRKFKRLTLEDMQRLMMLLTSMRIVCNAYGQHDWKQIEAEVLSARRVNAELKRKIDSPKLDEFRDVLSDLLETPGQKIVVFSQWERMLRLSELYVRDIIEAAGARSLVFSGKLSLKKRAELVKRFNDDPSARVFFSTDAGGVGLNLQHAANCVVNLETPWNPAVLEQRVGRVLRMGQKKSVEVVNLISSDCIEERIFNLVAQKKALFAGVFDPSIKDVRFNADQAASFLDKMKRLVPDGSVPAAAEPMKPSPLPVNLDSVAAVTPLAAAAPPSAPIELVPGLSVRVSEDADSVHFTLPKPALAALQSLRPMFEALLKLSGGR